MKNHLLISAIVYALAFISIDIFLSEEEIDVRLEVHEISKDGAITFKICNYGPDVYYRSYRSIPGESVVFYGDEWGLNEDWCCFPPPEHKLGRGKGILFKVSSDYDRAIYPWRYLADFYVKTKTPEWISDVLDKVYKQSIERTKHRELASSVVYHGVLQE